MLTFRTSSGLLNVDPTAILGKGTAGTVYQHPTNPLLCIKIYEPAIAATHGPKVAAMVASPPPGLTAQSSGVTRIQAAWPIETVHDGGAVAGFIMPRIEFSESWSLTEVLAMSETDQLPRRRLLSFLINLSGMVSNIHRVGHRIIDFNPANFRVYKADGFVGLIDCDGYQIQKSSGRGYFPAEVAWEEHAAPDAIRNDGALDQQALNGNALLQDHWALSLIAFRLLNRNIFPYDGIPLPGKGAQIPATNPLRVLNCNLLYPYGTQPSTLLKPLPHSLHGFFPTEIAAAFTSAFQASQPVTADAWLSLLASYRSGNRICPNNANHWRLSGVCEQCAQSIVPAKPPIQVKAAIPPTPTSAATNPIRPPPPWPPPTPPGPIVVPITRPVTSPKSGANIGGIAAVVAVIFALGWLVQRVGAHGSPPSPAYPISNFATPLREQAASTKLNVRSGPGPSYAVIKHVAQGDTLTGYGTAQSSDGGTWQYVQLGDGSYGYVNAKLVQAVSPVSPAAVAPAPVTVAAAAPAPVPAPVTQPSPAPVDSPQPVVNPAAEEAGRVQQIITSSNFYQDQSPDSGAIPGRSMMLRADATYANARVGDVVQGGLIQNGRMIARCDAINLQIAGNFWCRLPVYSPGDYAFLLSINGVQVVTHEFGIHPQPRMSAEPTYASQQAAQLQQLLAQQAARQITEALRRSHR